LIRFGSTGKHQNVNKIRNQHFNLVTSNLCTLAKDKNTQDSHLFTQWIEQPITIQFRVHVCGGIFPDSLQSDPCS